MSGANLTENDQRILAMAWHCFAEMSKVRIYFPMRTI